MRNLVLVMVCLAIAFPISAEVYRYKDGAGVLHFTDNLMDVPQEQRETADVYPEIRYQASDPKLSDAPEKPQDLSQKNIRQEHKVLLQEQQALDQLFLKLEAEKKDLVKEKEGITSAKQLQAFKAKIDAFNENVNAFKIRKQSFEKKSRVFNNTIKQSDSN